MRLQKLRNERHADEETRKQGKGKKKKDNDQDKGKQSKHSLPKEAGTAAAAKAWRHNQLIADKGVKRCAIHPSLPAYCAIAIAVAHEKLMHVMFLHVAHMQ